MPSLLIATGQRLVRLERSGDTLTAREVAEAPVRVLAVDRGEGHLYAAGKDRVLRSSDAGRRWEPLETPATNVFAMAVSAADGAVYLGTEPSRLFRSRDHGQTWTELTALQKIPSKPTWSFPPRPDTHHVRAIAPSPVDPERLLVGIELGGVMLSEDDGRSFSDHRPTAEKDCHDLIWHPDRPDRIYEAAGGGAAFSDDGGRTWTSADRGRDRNYCWAQAIDPGDPTMWFLSAAESAGRAHSSDGSADARLLRWQGDGPWQRADAGLPDPLDSMPYALIFDNGTLYTALRDGRFFASDDRGDQWAAMSIDGPKPETVLSLVAVGQGQ